jgi:hypothetical protein
VHARACIELARACMCVNTALCCMTAHVHLLRREGGHPVLYNAVYIYYIQAARCCAVLHSTCIKLCMYTPEGPHPNFTVGLGLPARCCFIVHVCGTAL